VQAVRGAGGLDRLAVKDEDVISLDYMARVILQVGLWLLVNVIGF
jgi:hypothetical protein